ncbi:hypothetical protein M422DRAFT_259489 [Sphaerobolus stellatus SS14]|uniref:Uncharacterized protein n=1 Tax=Sphaerobolus stellatus (strain SS14) TaxID=990650 RepID=A0A0C9VKB6_SPHS4|nr:hypothetical protein M422DRAFT_259489 [Sphaerobolus stellatus SS14]
MPPRRPACRKVEWDDAQHVSPKAKKPRTSTTTIQFVNLTAGATSSRNHPVPTFANVDVSPSCPSTSNLSSSSTSNLLPLPAYPAATPDTSFNTFGPYDDEDFNMDSLDLSFQPAKEPTNDVTESQVTVRQARKRYQASDAPLREWLDYRADFLRRLDGI